MQREYIFSKQSKINIHIVVLYCLYHPLSPSLSYSHSHSCSLFFVFVGEHESNHIKTVHTIDLPPRKRERGGNDTNYTDTVAIREIACTMPHIENVLHFNISCQEIFYGALRLYNNALAAHYQKLFLFACSVFFLLDIVFI